MFPKIYLEITDVCNLSCDFCPGTVRPLRFLAKEEFTLLAAKLKPHTDYLYFHLMGEPLLHPKLGEFIDIAGDMGFKVCLTTNGTLIEKRQAEILARADKIYKISISLHSFEGNGGSDGSDGGYFDSCMKFQKSAAEAGIITVLRLWNLDGDLPGLNSQNDRIISKIHEKYPSEWTKTRSGYRMTDRAYLEFGERFSWPDMDAEESGGSFCLGLRDHVGVLCDGTVVPCCLDNNGNIPLGNLFDSELSEILESERARAIYDGFSRRCPSEELCRRCGYSKRFG